MTWMVSILTCSVWNRHIIFKQKLSNNQLQLNLNDPDFDFPIYWLFNKKKIDLKCVCNRWNSELTVDKCCGCRKRLKQTEIITWAAVDGEGSTCQAKRQVKVCCLPLRMAWPICKWNICGMFCVERSLAIAGSYQNLSHSSAGERVSSSHNVSRGRCNWALPGEVFHCTRHQGYWI